MNTNVLIYYIFNLIRDGHRWQNTNLNGRAKPPRFYFSFLQWVAMAISIIFVIKAPQGLSSEATNCILSCLSIMVALFLSLILSVFDKSKNITESDGSSATRLHKWNFYRQFTALMAYVILLSLLVIVFIVIGRIFNIKFDLSEYQFVNYKMWGKDTIATFIVCASIVMMRIFTIYFLIDFFIICLYAVCSIYQYMQIEFNVNKPDKLKVYNEEDIEQTFKREHDFDTWKIKAILFLLLVLASIVLCIML